MPSPSASLATLRPDLQGSFMEFDLEMSRRGFIASQVLPVIDVQKPAGKFGIFSIEQLLQTRATDRAPGSGYSRGRPTFSSVSFSTEEHGAEEPVDDREASMYAEYFDAEQISALRAYDAVARNAEIRAATLIFNATTWTGAALTTAVTTEWSTAASATPRADVKAARKKVLAGAGIWPNTLIINRNVFENLIDVAEIIDRVKYSGHTDPKAGNIDEVILAQALGIPRVIVAGGIKNTGNEGAAATIAQVWSDEYAMVCQVATSNDIKEACVGRTFHWPGDGSDPMGTIETYREEAIRGDIVRVRHDVDEVVLYVQAGHLLSNITA